MATMKQQVMIRPAKADQEAEIIFNDVEIPAPKKDEVLVTIVPIHIGHGSNAVYNVYVFTWGYFFISKFRITSTSA